MAITLPLDEMPIQEKLAAMELLWQDLARSPEAVESPDWHWEILEQRLQRVAGGLARFEEWEKAKMEIRHKAL